MKVLFAALIAPALFASIANAKTMACASGKEEILYFQDGQLVMTADVVASDKIENVEMSFLPDRKLGASETEVQAQKKGDWMRFYLDGDAWCSYKVVVPSNFSRANGSFIAIVDAVCEENINSTIRMNCRLR